MHGFPESDIYFATVFFYFFKDFFLQNFIKISIIFLNNFSSPPPNHPPTERCHDKPQNVNLPNDNWQKQPRGTLTGAMVICRRRFCRMFFCRVMGLARLINNTTFVECHLCRV
jgi:hypothetical protein